MPLWQRLPIAVAGMLLTSFFAGLIWYRLFDAGIPAYLGGLVGGVTAVPIWELLKKIR